MSDLTPLIRIGLYILAGYLVDRGLPPQAADIISNDPLMIDIVTNVLAAVIAGGALIWWRVAKRLGWST